MAYRGSLKRCIQMMGYQFHAGNYDHLSILCHPKGKYYTLFADDEFGRFKEDLLTKKCYPIACLTSKELSQFIVNTQEALKLDTPPDD